MSCAALPWTEFSAQHPYYVPKLSEEENLKEESPTNIYSALKYLGMTLLQTQQQWI